VKRRPSPYQRIVRAAKQSRGVRLSPEECFDMSLDTAIAEVAANDEDRPRQLTREHIEEVYAITGEPE